MNKEGNTLEVTTDSISLFAISSHSENSSAQTHNDTAEIINSTSHNHKDNEIKPISVSFSVPGNTTIALELDSRNSLDSPLPGNPIKFFRIAAGNLSYDKVNIELVYPDSGLNGTDENNLSIFHYANSTWTNLPTEVNGDKNTLRASVESLSLFAIASFSGEGHNMTGHNMSMDMGIVSDCLRCHGSRTIYFGGMMEGMTPKVNESIMNQSIHSNLNNASSNLNKACCACHGNGTMPATHPEEYLAPRSCASCHSFATAYNAPAVSGHTKAGENLTLKINCERCHGNSPVKSGLNGTKSNVSHYQAKIAYNSTDCLSCHGNPANATKWGNASLVYSHVKNGSCTECHETGQTKTLHADYLTT